MLNSFDIMAGVWTNRNHKVSQLIINAVCLPVLEIVKSIYFMSLGKRKLEFREDILGEYFNVDKIRAEMSDVVDYMREQFLENISVRSSTGMQ